jgi:hypothetical protein
METNGQLNVSAVFTPRVAVVICTVGRCGFGFVEVVSISICEKTTTLIILEVQLVQHFIEDTDIQGAAS